MIASFKFRDQGQKSPLQLSRFLFSCCLECLFADFATFLEPIGAISQKKYMIAHSALKKAHRRTILIFFRHTKPFQHEWSLVPVIDCLDQTYSNIQKKNHDSVLILTHCVSRVVYQGLSKQYIESFLPEPFQKLAIFISIFITVPMYYNILSTRPTYNHSRQ